MFWPTIRTPTLLQVDFTKEDLSVGSVFNICVSLDAVNFSSFFSSFMLYSETTRILTGLQLWGEVGSSDSRHYFEIYFSARTSAIKSPPIKNANHLSMPENVLPEASFHLKIQSNSHYC
jgi:hypothetical protein